MRNAVPLSSTLIYSPAQRCLDIVELLADAPEGLALSAIGLRLGVPKSATHRFLALLAARGFVRQDAATQHYRLTLKLTALGARFLAGTHLTDAAQPVLDDLAVRSGELARLAVVEGDGLTWVAKAQGALSGLRYDPDAGRSVMLPATASGKAWLATLPEATALGIVTRAGFPDPRANGPRVARTPAQLRRELKATRARGYGEAVDEGAPGVAAVAAAVRAQARPDAAVIATVSVAGPLARMDAPRRADLGRMVMSAAEELAAVWPVRMQLAAAHAA